MCFTANTSAAIKLVAESYPFGRRRGLVLSQDNHNSVNGMREFARAKGASVDYAPLTMPDLRIDRAALLSRLEAADASHPNLFAFPRRALQTPVGRPLTAVRSPTPAETQIPPLTDAWEGFFT